MKKRFRIDENKCPKGKLLILTDLQEQGFDFDSCSGCEYFTPKGVFQGHCNVLGSRYLWGFSTFEGVINYGTLLLGTEIIC